MRSHDPEQMDQSRAPEAPDWDSKVTLPAVSLWFFIIFSFFLQAHKIIEHRRKYDRKREEKEVQEKQERVKKAREAHARAQRVSGCVLF